MWVYRQSYGIKPTDPGAKFQIGYYKPPGNEWITINEHTSQEAAALEVHFMNGGDARLIQIRLAIEENHKALDRRENGNSANALTVQRIEEILGTPWRGK